MELLRNSTQRDILKLIQTMKVGGDVYLYEQY